MGILSGLSETRVFEYFELLSSVPHGSGNTKAISDLCVAFAKERGLDYYQDSLNNVIIYKGATKGYEDRESVILQGHIDMVCQKAADCSIDMEKEPIKLLVEGDWISAEGTTLGGDNGIAVAMILAILDDDNIAHPPIEAVLTVDEETGMFGAIGLDTSCLKSKRMINLDSEDEGVFTAGCAGGRRLNCSLPVKRESGDGLAFIEITIDGLLSGHSGVDINRGRGSANRLMGRLLHKLSTIVDIRLASMAGGELDNVIPKLCCAVIGVKAEDADTVYDFACEMDKVYKNELSASDPGVCVKACAADAAPLVVSKEDTERALLTMIMMPYHVQEMSMEIDGLVQTSLNMGVLRLSEESFDFSFSVRSSITSQKEDLIFKVRSIASYMGATVSEHGDYPAWQFAKNSPLREAALEAYRDLYKKEGTVSATHGGLECGLFVDRIKGLDCVSFGPDMKDVHSPSERLCISSSIRTYELLLEILKRL